MKVIFWDKTEFEVENREEAITKITSLLSGWSQAGDRLAWYYRGPHGIENIGPPNYVVVVNADDEHTDASAVIID